MNYLKLKQKIYEAIERNPLDRSAYEEMFILLCRERSTDFCNHTVFFPRF